MFDESELATIILAKNDPTIVNYDSKYLECPVSGDALTKLGVK